MTPVELLQSTQRAVASQEMINMHEQLKTICKDQKEVQMSVNTDQETLNNLESRQRMQEADVQRMREREDVLKRVNNLEKAAPTVRYKVVRKQHVENKKTIREMQNELQQLKTAAGPALQAVNRKREYRDQIDKVLRYRRDLVSKAENKADAVDRRFQTLQDDSTALDAKRSSEKESVKTRKLEVAKHEATVREQKILLQQRPPEVDAAAYNEKMVRLARKLEKYYCIDPFPSELPSDSLKRRKKISSNSKSVRARLLRMAETLMGRSKRLNTVCRTLSPNLENRFQSSGLFLEILRICINGYKNIRTNLKNMFTDRRL